MNGTARAAHEEGVGGVASAAPCEDDVQGEERRAGREEDGAVLVSAQRVPAKDDVEGADGHECRPGEARCPQPAGVDPAHGAEFNRGPRFPPAVRRRPGGGLAARPPGRECQPQIVVVGASSVRSSSGIVAAGSRIRSGFLSWTTTRTTYRASATTRMVIDGMSVERVLAP